MLGGLVRVPRAFVLQGVERATAGLVVAGVVILLAAVTFVGPTPVLVAKPVRFITATVGAEELQVT